MDHPSSTRSAQGQKASLITNFRALDSYYKSASVLILGVMQCQLQRPRLPPGQPYRAKSRHYQINCAASGLSSLGQLVHSGSSPDIDDLDPAPDRQRFRTPKNKLDAF